jgi:putative DNA primase/helicase
MSDHVWVGAPGYEINLSPEEPGVTKMRRAQDGSYVRGEPITAAPINVTETGTDDYGTQYATVAWLNYGKLRSLTLTCGELYGKGVPMSLLNGGAPVSAANWYKVQMFLQAQQSAQPLPSFQVRRAGWSRDLTAFTMGGRVYGAEGRVVSSDAAFSSALKAQGNPVQYRSVIDRVLASGPLPEMCWAAGYAAPLLHLLNVRSMTLSIWGASGSGKSALQALAVSPWGRPADLKLSADISRAALEVLMAQRNDSLVWIDDTQQTQTQEFLEKLTYNIGNGSSARRATQDGGLREGLQWRSLVLVSGERPLHDIGADAGAQNRAVELEVKEPLDPHLARALHVELEESHGLTGPAFIEKLIKIVQRGKREEIRRIYTSMLDTLRHEADAGEANSYVAVLAMADYMARVIVLGQSEADAEAAALACGRAVTKLCSQAKVEVSNSKDEETGILEAFVMQNGSCFDRPKEPHNASQFYGRVTEDGTIYILPPVLKKLLGEHRINRRAFLSRQAWRMDTNGSTTSKVITESGRSTRFYVFKPVSLAEDDS